MRRTVFWRVALVLVGAQVATGLLGVGLSAFLAQARSQELLRGTLQLRLDAAADEAERRASFDERGHLALPPLVRQDLATRFPDPLAVLGPDGEALAVFGGPQPALTDEAREALEEGRLAVTLGGPEGSWALAPLLAPDGLPAGALYVRPLTGTLAEETQGTREAFRRATWAAALLAALSALLLGALFTWRLVRPLRRMTRAVEALGEGDYAARLPAEGEDELGRLGAAINDMAGRVEASVGELRATDRLRRELVANVGHDLRTPLAALQAYLEEADRTAALGQAERAAGLVAAARRQAEGVAGLVSDLFELSILERPPAEVPLHLGPVPLGELVRDAAEVHRPACKRAGLALHVHAPPGLPTLEADGARLMRLVGNLLANACRHTAEGGSVRLEASAEGDRARLDVVDTGEGIAPGDLAQVFERYYRGASARTRVAGGGTGLGLAISRAIARAHGGDLTAASAPGEGSRFTLVLPLEPPPSARPPGPERPLPLPAGPAPDLEGPALP